MRWSGLVRLGAALLVAVLVSAACSSGGTPAAHTTSESAPPGPVLSSSTATTRVLRASDLGKAFAPDRYVEFTAPLPCDTADAASAQKQTDAVFSVGRQFRSTKPAAVVREAVLGYRSDDAAKHALLTIRDIMQCVTGHEDQHSKKPVTVLVGAESDVSKKIGSPQAYSWTLVTLTERGAYVAMRADSAVVLLRVSIDVKDLSNGAKVPDGTEIATTAYQRMIKG